MARFVSIDDPRWDTVLKDKPFGEPIEGFHRIPRVYRWWYVVRGTFFDSAVKPLEDWLEDPSRPGEVYVEHQTRARPLDAPFGTRHTETWVFCTDPNVAFEFTMAWT